MTGGTSRIDRTRLARLLALLGSNFPGERDAAGQAAHRLVTAAGLSWEEALQAPPSPKRARSDPEQEIWKSLARRCASHPEKLNLWERQFLAGLPSFSKLSERQRPILDRIAARLREQGIPL